jgi:hypothetical protein
MAFYYTSDELIKSIKTRSAIPTSQNRFTNEDFLRFANEEMALGVVPSILRNHEDYFLISEDIPIITSKNKYPIPYRAIGNKVREIALIDSNGSVYEMTRIGVGDLPFYNTAGKVYAYYLANNDINLVPEKLNNANGMKLRISYYVRPNTLVLLKDIAIISSIDRSSGIIQVNALPTTFSQSIKYDLVQIKSPHKCVKFEITPTAMNTTLKTVTFNLSDIPDELEVGDHLTLATESAIPQIPSDMHMILAHRVATRLLEAQGDTEGLQNANQKLQELEKQTETLIDNRVEDSPKKVVNRHAILKSGLNSRYRRYR